MCSWKSEAERLFLIDHQKISDIALKLEKTRKTISEYLQALPGFNEEKERRKVVNSEKRPEYKRNWEQNNRNSPKEDEAAMLKRQHNIDVAVLSYERI